MGAGHACVTWHRAVQTPGSEYWRGAGSIPSNAQLDTIANRLMSGEHQTHGATRPRPPAGGVFDAESAPVLAHFPAAYAGISGTALVLEIDWSDLGPATELLTALVEAPNNASLAPGSAGS